MTFPESDEARSALQIALENNLANLLRITSPCATPWGNVPIIDLMNAKRPDHVLERIPLMMRMSIISKFAR